VLAAALHGTVGGAVSGRLGSSTSQCARRWQQPPQQQQQVVLMLSRLLVKQPECVQFVLLLVFAGCMRDCVWAVSVCNQRTRSKRKLALHLGIQIVTQLDLHMTAAHGSRCLTNFVACHGTAGWAFAQQQQDKKPIATRVPIVNAWKLPIAQCPITGLGYPEGDANTIFIMTGPAVQTDSKIGVSLQDNMHWCTWQGWVMSAARELLARG
jgi:hypothetical protein